MKIEYQHIFGLPRKIVWKYIKDEKVLRNTIPNCKSLVQVANGFYQAQVDIQLGPLKDVFELEVKVEKEKSPAFCHVFLKGKGNLGEFTGKADVILNDHQGGTKVNIHSDVEITGALAGAAQRVLNGGANKGVEKFLYSLEKEIKKNLYLIRKGRNR
ncbi:CoxG family protein [Neobacillus vireti]|uniref:CoxG family protein n=1 Tax=Neobacillus vireti TaxID=220686 RepID=UPI002FFEE2F1